MGTTGPKPKARPDQHHDRTSSNSMQTASTGNWPRNLPTTLRQVFNTIPVGTRSIGYLTKLLKPTFGINNFEESFSNWKFEPNRYERDNTTRLPDPVKIAILMSETTGQLQQHLRLNARATPTHAEAL